MYCGDRFLVEIDIVFFHAAGQADRVSWCVGPVAIGHQKTIIPDDLSRTGDQLDVPVLGRFRAAP